MHPLGNHLIVGVQSTILSDLEKKLWAELSPAGTILFRRNFADSPDWIEQLTKLLFELRTLSEREDLIVSIDHEGGRVHRLIEPVTHFPAPNSWGDSVFAVGKAMGEELACLGIDLNFAPSFDVLLEKKNRVIGDRSFSEDASIVAVQGLEFLNGLESAGVTGCAKHFPGHGGTVEDSHLSLPVVSTSMETLQSLELVPFVEYIRSGRKLIMTSHVLFQEIDPIFPATLSEKLLSDLLRKELGYTGAIITDALDMGAISSIPLAETCERFFKIGGDLLCICQNPEVTPIQVAHNLAATLRFNLLSEELAASLKRIDGLKKQMLVTKEAAVRSPSPLSNPDHKVLNIALRSKDNGDGVV